MFYVLREKNNEMTEQEYREAHEEFMKRLDALDRQCVFDAPESPEEAKWNEERMNELDNI
jgi:hypothetical protein